MSIAKPLNVILLAGFVSLSSQGQSLTAADLQQVKDVVAGKALVIRGYSGTDPAFEVADGHWRPAVVSDLVFASFTVQGVDQTQDYLVFHGERKLVVQILGTNSLAGTQGGVPVSLYLPLHDLENTASLPSRLMQEVFFPSLVDAFAAIPVWEKLCLPLRYARDTKTVLPAPRCTRPMDPSEASTVPPKVLHSETIDIPISIQGSGPTQVTEILIGLTVNERGEPTNVHAFRPTNSGLTQRALAAVKRYRFEPATREGMPVAVPLNVAIRFEYHGQ